MRSTTRMLFSRVVSHAGLAMAVSRRTLLVALLLLVPAACSFGQPGGGGTSSRGGGSTTHPDVPKPLCEVHGDNKFYLAQGAEVDHVDDHAIPTDRGQTADCQAVDATHLYALHQGNTLYFDQKPWPVSPSDQTEVVKGLSVAGFSLSGDNSVLLTTVDGAEVLANGPWPACAACVQQVDANALSAQALPTTHALSAAALDTPAPTVQTIFVLHLDGSLSMDQGPWQRPTRQPVDANVQAFQALDTNTVFVVDASGQLSLDQSPWPASPNNQRAIDSNVRMFQALDASTIYVLDSNGTLWLEHGGASNRVLISANTAAFQALDANTVYVLDMSGTLSLYRGPWSTPQVQWIDGNVTAFQSSGASAAVPVPHPGAGPVPTPVAGTFAEYPLSDGKSYPWGITNGPDGNLWFTEATADQIGQITPLGVITEFPLPSKPDNPYGITAGPDGNLWFTEVGLNSDGSIGQMTPKGSLHDYPACSSCAPQGITTGPDGNLWFTAGNGIWKITTSGTVSSVANIPTTNAGPYAITTGPDGNLWFTESFGNKIGRITPSGTISEFAIPTDQSYPEGIANGPDGNLWFTETNANQIGRITPSGTITEFAVPSGG